MIKEQINIETLSDTKLFDNLSPAQYEQIIIQIENHKHDDYTTDMVISESIILNQFKVHKNVMRPEIMASVLFAKFLAKNTELISGKKILDMGCGSGILGITAALLGASNVVFSDLLESCCYNTRENIRLFELERKTEVVRGNLFENVSGSFDLIIFNHPFFGANPLKEMPITFSMMNSGRLLHQFLSESSNFTSKIIMPFLKLAGLTNDPEEHAEGYNFKLTKKELSKNSGDSIQKGEIKFCVFDYIDFI